MKTRIVVNGVTVYTNKQVRTVTGSIVRFVDGSSADLDTRTLINVGEGYLTFDAAAAVPEVELVTVSKRYPNITRLALSRVDADVKVVVGSAVTEVVLEGDKVQVSECDIVESNGCLTIRGPENSGGSNLIVSERYVTQKNAGGILGALFGRQSRQSVEIYSTSGDRIKITVTVPEGTSLEIEDGHGALKIGDTHGSVSLEIGGQRQVNIGAITDGTFSLSGQASVSVRDITAPNLTATLAGQSELHISEGTVETVHVTTSGQSSFMLNGAANYGHFSSRGQSVIDVTHVTHVIERSKTGQSRIRVNH